MENYTKSLLKKCGVPPHLMGYDYAGEAIELIHEDRNYLRSITASLYPTIAKKFGVRPGSVERAIRTAIDAAFDNICDLPPETIKEIFGNTIPAKTGKPTNAHFLATLADMMYD